MGAGGRRCAQPAGQELRCTYLGRHFVDATITPGVAARYPHRRQVAAARRAVLLQRRQGIDRTRGRKTAGRTQ